MKHLKRLLIGVALFTVVGIAIAILALYPVLGLVLIMAGLSYLFGALWLDEI